jgi:hypothetical protein
VLLIKRGRSSSSPELVDFGVDAGGVVGEAGALPELGGLFAGGEGLLAPGSRVSRGGPSVLSIPTGVMLALLAFTGSSIPTGCHTPVPSHGVGALVALLCSALPTVNRPRELPARSPS